MWQRPPLGPQAKPYEEGWLHKLLARRNVNVAAVALANKNARIVWALLAHGRQYQPGYDGCMRGVGG